MTHLRGKQSRKCKIRHKRFVEERETARAIVLCFQYKDPINGEIVWAPGEFEEVVRAILKVELGYEPQYAVDYEYGEVLNRFPIKPFSSHNYLGRGSSKNDLLSTNCTQRGR